MVRRFSLLAVAALIAAAGVCHAETVISGAVTTTTWAKAGSPYVLAGDARVLFGETLIIEPGVTVRSHHLVVNGRLIALGAAGDSILFDGTRVVFDHALPSQMRYTRVSDVHVSTSVGSIDGGGVSVVASSVTIAHSRITGNVADVTNTGAYIYGEARGGGLAAVDGAFVQMDSCDVSGNTATGLGRAGMVMRLATGRGGGLCCENSTVVVTNSTVSGNEANSVGSAAIGCGLRFVNCVIAGNVSPPAWGEGGVPVTVCADLFENCTIAGNTRTPVDDDRYHFAAVSAGTLTNCIVWGNGRLAVSDSCTASYCDIEMDSTGVFPGEGNVAADPLFADSVAGDYTLLPGSPCIDAGDPTSGLDIDGTRADMGASSLRPATQPARLHVQATLSLSRTRPETLHVANPSDVPISIDSVSLPSGFFIGTKLPFVVSEGAEAGIAVWYSSATDTTGAMLVHWRALQNGSPGETSVVALRMTPGTAVAGAVRSTTWTRCGSPYVVTGPCGVPEGEELRIEPGVTVEFDQYVPFVVEGRIHAAGGEGDSIRFRPGRSDWAGIHISGGDSSSFRYVVIEGGRGPTYDRTSEVGNVFGGGCPSDVHGAGLCVCSAGTRVSVADCMFRENRAWARVDSYVNGTVYSGYGGALFAADHASVRVARSTFLRNEAGDGGAAVCVRDSADVTIERCLLHDNWNRTHLHSIPMRRGPAYGVIGVYDGASCTVSACTMTRSSMSEAAFGVRVYAATMTMTNTIVWNSLLVMRDSTSTLDVTYSDIGAHGMLEYNPYDWTVFDGVFPGEGNLSEDPLFTDPASGDFSLREDSPCVNTGDPLLTDPNGSRSDMGAIPYTGPVSVTDSRPMRFTLSQNLPNPFNPVTTISYAIAEAGLVTLSVYNLQGQLVRTLVQEVVQPGERHAVWDGCDFASRPAASGVYVCRLTAPEGALTRRMLLVR